MLTAVTSTTSMTAAGCTSRNRCVILDPPTPPPPIFSTQIVGILEWKYEFVGRGGVGCGGDPFLRRNICIMYHVSLPSTTTPRAGDWLSHFIAAIKRGEEGNVSGILQGRKNVIRIPEYACLRMDIQDVEICWTLHNQPV